MSAMKSLLRFTGIFSLALLMASDVMAGPARGTVPARPSPEPAAPPAGLSARIGPVARSTDKALNRLTLDQYIVVQLNRAHMPGLSAAIVKGGKVVWTGTYGHSRVPEKEFVTTNTLFEIASVSKTIIATAVMQLWEIGAIDLDKDINTYLPFRVVNPNSPTNPITMRMLMTHTSSIVDNNALTIGSYTWNKPIIPLGEFLKQYLTPGGQHYNARANFMKHVPPGVLYEYSNFASCLAAYIVECVSGIPYDQYCQQEIFDPLGMTETSYRFADFNTSRIAMTYNYRTLSRTYTPYGFYDCPLYPAGWVITSTPQLARFLNCFIQYGELDGVRILERRTVEEMRRVQYGAPGSAIGLFWYYKELDGYSLLGHNGGNFGVSAEMFFRPSDGVGVILLMNGDWTVVNLNMISDIEARLFQEAAKYP